MFSTRHLIVFLIILPSFIGCGVGKATLFVDNDSKNGFKVEIEGQKGLFVSPGKFGKRHLPYGEHKVKVTQKNKVIFEKTIQLEPYDNGPGWRHYLLDPHGDTRYAVHDFYYYDDMETANSSKSSRKVKSLSKRKWVDVPQGAMALEAMPVTFSTEPGNKTSRLCVVRDK